MIVPILRYLIIHYETKGRVKKKFKKLAFDQKGGGGRRKNQLANFIFYFSTNNEYGI